MKLKGLSMAILAGAFAAQATAGTVTSDGADIILKTKGGFEVKRADKKASFRIGGRIQWDYNNATFDPDVAGADDRTEESQFDVRRARIYTKGHYGNWAYKAQFNLDDEGSSGGDIEDLYIRYTGWGKAAQVTIGRAKAPFGLEELTSSKDISILERSAITELFVPGRQDGIQFHGKNGIFTYGIGAYEAGDDNGSCSSSTVLTTAPGANAGDPATTVASTATSCDTRGSDTTAKNIAVAGRLTAAPINEEGSVLHLGVGFQNVGGDERSNGGNVANFGLEDAYNLEFGWVAGPFHLQAEYFDGTLAQFGGTNTIDGDDDVDGYYVQAGFILTGESRPYKDGKFKIVKPSTDQGAWEVVARLEDGSGDFGDIELGTTEASAYTLGLNYYTGNVRIGANYTMGERDEDGSNDDEGEEFRVRFQYVY